jgi:fatty-acyl-CoA synthase
MFDGDLLSERARDTPDRTALVHVETGERLTYAQLNERSENAAATLQALGIEKGDRFGLLAFNCREFLEFFFAAGKIGAIVVPLSTRATAHELKHIVEDCGMKFYLHGPEFELISACRRIRCAHRRAAAWLPHSCSLKTRIACFTPQVRPANPRA